MKNQTAQNNHSWKGDDVSYKGLHKWISDNLGSAKKHKCSVCNGKSGSETMNWSNLDHKYNRDFSKWLPMCKKCHSEYDQNKFGCYSYDKSETHKQNISKNSKGISRNKGVNNPMYGVAPWNKKTLA